MHASLNYVIQDAVRLGVGVAAHQNQFKFKADGLGDDFEFKSTAGPMFEVAYKWFGLVYTSMNYEDENPEPPMTPALSVLLSTEHSKQVSV